MIHYDHEWVGSIITERNALRIALEEAIEWARRPDPLPIARFDEFLARMGKLGVGPRAAATGCICPSHASNRGECPIHDDKGRVREASA